LEKMKEAIRYGFILTIVCIVASGLLAGVNRLTRPRIEELAGKEKRSSLKAVLPQAESFEEVKADDKILYYRAYDKNKNSVGTAFIASAKGYSSTIDTMVGMLNDGTINAITVLQQSETPGLGDRIKEVRDALTILDVLRGKKRNFSLSPWFQQQFSGKKMSEFSDIQAITGATISSKAVIDSVKEKAEEIKKLIQKE